MADTSTRGSESSRSAGRVREWLGVAVVLAAVAGLLLTALGHRHDFVDSFGRIGPVAWVASLCLGVVANLLVFPVWRSILLGLGVRWPVLPSGRLFFTSQLGKYVPGSVWPVVIQMEAATRWRTRRSSVVVAQALTILTTSCAGLALGVVLLGIADHTAVSRVWWAAVAVPVLVVALHPGIQHRLADLGARLLGRDPFDEWVATSDLLRAGAWSVPLWLMMGAHAAVVAAAMGHRDGSALVVVVAAVCLAMPAGTLFVPAPAGGGVRELVMVLVLAQVMPTGDALALTITSRVVLMVADALLALAAWTAGRTVAGRH